MTRFLRVSRVTSPSQVSSQLFTSPSQVPSLYLCDLSATRVQVADSSFHLWSKHINREAKGRKRCGRKKCTSNRDNRTLERIVKQNPFKNVGEIHKEWTAAGVGASRTTTHRRMQDMGFRCRSPCVKPLLNNRQRQKRLAWAKDKKDWTAAEWSKVMFSDESKFCISFGNQGPRVWRKRG